LAVICAVSDIHSPRYLDLFRKALADVDCGDGLFILAGDIVEKNQVTEYRRVLGLIESLYPGVRVVSVFGNEEYWGYENEYARRYPSVTWINDSYQVVKAGNVDIAVVGSRGALDKPTSWQARNMPGISRYYSELPSKISRLISEASSHGFPVILVTHYGVTYRNLLGENPAVYPYLASRSMEKIITEYKSVLRMVIHGHAHNGIVEEISIDGVKVYNVALPARGRITRIIL